MKSTRCYPNVGVVNRGDDSLNRWRFLGCFAVFSWPVYTLSFHHPTYPSVRAGKYPTRSPTLRASTQGGDGRAQNSSGAFRLAYFSDSVELQTVTYKLLPKLQFSTVGGTGNVQSQTEIVLTSMVHLADDRYYDEILLDAASFDRVLFELIVGPDVYGFDEDGKKAILANVFPTREQEVLARNYGLSAQLNCLDYCGLCKQRLQDGTSSRWVLADLSRDEIQRLQKASGEREIGQPAWRGFIEEIGRALVVGRQAGEKDLPRFFPPLGSSLNKPALFLRALLWLTPCPEAEMMLLDWARTYPRAGGISAVVSAIAEAALSGDLFTARKLGFAQEIVSGQAGGSNWGLSDDIVISARNRVAVEETERALADGCRKVMILYGGLHIQDLAFQLCKRLDASQEAIGWRSAWKIATKAKTKAKANARAEAEAEAGVPGGGATAAPTPGVHGGGEPLACRVCDNGPYHRRFASRAARAVL